MEKEVVAPATKFSQRQVLSQDLIKFFICVYTGDVLKEGGD